MHFRHPVTHVLSSACQVIVFSIRSEHRLQRFNNFYLSGTPYHVPYDTSKRPLKGQTTLPIMRAVKTSSEVLTVMTKKTYM
jgi:hypothetical protein